MAIAFDCYLESLGIAAGFVTFFGNVIHSQKQHLVEMARTDIATRHGSICITHLTIRSTNQLITVTNQPVNQPTSQPMDRSINPLACLIHF